MQVQAARAGKSGILKLLPAIHPSPAARLTRVPHDLRVHLADLQRAVLRVRVAVLVLVRALQAAQGGAAVGGAASSASMQRPAAFRSQAPAQCADLAPQPDPTLCSLLQHPPPPLSPLQAAVHHCHVPQLLQLQRSRHLQGRAPPCGHCRCRQLAAPAQLWSQWMRQSPCGQGAQHA